MFPNLSTSEMGLIKRDKNGMEIPLIISFDFEEAFTNDVIILGRRGLKKMKELNSN